MILPEHNLDLASAADAVQKHGPLPVAVEICVDDVFGALAAERAGARRIELCSALSEGGLTPSLGAVRIVLERVRHTGVQVMIRPRGGNFVLDKDDLAVMLADIAAIRALPHAVGVRLGFVFGALRPDGDIDGDAVQRLSQACGDAPLTFHKAFDRVADQSRALDQLIRLGMTRVLTSGGAETAEAGTGKLAALVRQAADHLVIMAGGSVRANNVRRLVQQTGVREVHLRAMRAQPDRPPMTAPEDIAAMVEALG